MAPLQISTPYGLLGTISSWKNGEGIQHLNICYRLDAQHLYKGTLSKSQEPLNNSKTLSHTLVAPQERLGIFPPHLPCEISEATLRQFQWFSPRFSSTFRSILIDLSVIINQLQTVSVSFNQFQAVSISFNQFD